MKKNVYDVLVIGGGHAGIEAANIAAKLGAKTLLVTQKIKTIALMPCNPSVGGPAKGVLVREISALGGLMGDVADISFLQTKILNIKKGPGVWAIRNQIDKEKYHLNIMKFLTSLKLLKIEEGLVKNIQIIDLDIIKIQTQKKSYYTKKLIITAGTYASSKILQGRNTRNEGPCGLETDASISTFLKNNNISLIRLKTGTPPRILTSSIHLNLLEKQFGNNNIWTLGIEKPLSNINIPCYLTHTNVNTHNVIKEYLDTSFLYDKDYKVRGPSRCPSIEDKVMRFLNKSKHQVFIEPNDRNFHISYLQGLSTSLSKVAQHKLLKTIKGLEDAQIVEYAYAIEYDAIQPTQLKATLEFKNLKNIYSAGQINGSSGYEEAAGQGLVAGINAVLSLKKQGELILPRDSSYIGMLIDDMIIKGVTQPYRLLTSMMTYRMYVRSDNAYERMSEISKKYHLLDSYIRKQLELFLHKKKMVYEFIKKAKRSDYVNVIPKLPKDLKINNLNLHSIIKNQSIHLKTILNNIPYLANLGLTNQEIEMLNIDLKYQGYIGKEKEIIDKLNKKNLTRLPESLDFSKIPNISHAAKESLNQFKPQTLGQARQLERVTISDIINLDIYIKKKAQNK